MIKTDFIKLYEDLNTLNEGYCLELAGYKVGDLVEFKYTKDEYKHGVVLDVWPKEENPRHIFGIFNLGSWGVVDTPFRDIIKKITINELTPKEKENYNKIQAIIDKRIKEVSNNLDEEVLEVEELNSLNEAVSPEVQSFYNSLKLTNKNPVDTESFIKAFKKDIPDNIWDQLFDTNMKLKHRGTYGIIKNGNLPEEVTAALKKYWAFQFASNVTWFETTTMIAKKEEAKRKEVEAKKAQEEKLISKAKEYIDRANHVLTLVDKTAMQKLLQLSKELEPEVATRISETPKVSANHYTDQKNKVGEPYSTVRIRFYDFWVEVYDGYFESTPTEQEIVDNFNSSVSRAIEKLEKIKAEKLAKQNRKEKYKNAKWYSKEFEEWASANRKGVFLFQLPEDEGIQRLTKLSWDVIERCRFTDDVELIAVITDYDPPMHNPYSATESSYYYRYYSVNSKANPADLEDEGILLDPSKFVDDSSWGEKHYREIPKQTVENDKDYFKTGMDRWFYYSSESYGTD